MCVEDQQSILAFLSVARAYPGAPPGARVDRIDTHSASIFLVGDRAYKLKRAVRYDYLDFSNPEQRRRFCEAEVALNRRTAPDLYLGVVPVTCDTGGELSIGGAGVAVDWLVAMRRFEDDQLLDRVSAQGRLDIALMAPLARAIARLHAVAEPCPARHGEAAMRWVVDGNARGFANEARDLLDAEQRERVIARSRATIEQHAALLEARSAAGLIRRCHGDLHLRNIVLWHGMPMPFDAVEFNDDIACIDVLYDVAFLLMDLWRLQLERHASELFNAYVMAVFDRGTATGLGLLPLFLSCRAAVRAKTNATACRLQSDSDRAAPLALSARRYLDLAEHLLAPVAPTLVAIGGPSGSGKSTVARAVAPVLGRCPGALVLRSDVIRKRLAGVAEVDRLGPDGYSAGMHARVYGELGEWAAAALAAGHAVITDAVFGSEEERQHIAAVARRAGVRFTGVWLDAPLDVLTARVSTRTGDASDAGADVIRRQVASGMGANAWHAVPAADDPDAVEARVRAALGLPGRVL